MHMENIFFDGCVKISMITVISFKIWIKINIWLTNQKTKNI